VVLRKFWFTSDGTSQL